MEMFGISPVRFMIRGRESFAAALAFSLFGGSALAVSTTLNLPPRASGAMTGSQFYAFVKTMTIAQREQAIYDQTVLGNVPPFMRNLKAVPVTKTGHTGTIYVIPDYFAIGSDADYFRMPMSLTMAAQIANFANASLTTPKMADAIRDAATVRLAPSPRSPATYTITSIDVFWDHNEDVDTHLIGQTLGALVAGDKKDVVTAAQLLNDNTSNFARVAIYGWPYQNNTNIQPLYTGHEEAYHDYSHGIRLVSQFMVYDGAETTVASVLNDATRKAILSTETPVIYYPSRADNGCFEGTVSVANVARSWTAWTATGSAPITYARGVVNHNDGDFSQNWNRADTAAFSGGVYQRIAVLPGYTYRLRAAMKRQSAFDGNTVAFGYDPNGGTDGNSASIQWTDLTGLTDDTWNSMTTTFVATGSFVTLFGKGGHSGTTGDTNADYYLDSVALMIASATGSTPTPSPSPTASATPSPSPNAQTAVKLY